MFEMKVVGRWWWWWYEFRKQCTADSERRMITSHDNDIEGLHEDK